jgi:hypothetical protein
VGDIGRGKRTSDRIDFPADFGSNQEGIHPYPLHGGPGPERVSAAFLYFKELTGLTRTEVRLTRSPGKTHGQVISVIISRGFDLGRNFLV